MKKNLSTTEMIKVVAAALEELNDRAVFVGGATVPFYLPPAYLALARPTDDIDIIFELVGRKGGWVNDEILRKKGFNHDTSEGAPICRWTYRGFKVDIMSTDEKTVGFTNPWYKEGIENSIEAISKPVSIKILNLPYFIATKLVAFNQRGKNDFMGSRDMEDIISVLDVSSKDLLEGMIPNCSDKLQKFLKLEFEKLLNTSAFIDAVPGAVFNRNTPIESTEQLIARIKKIIEFQ